MYYLIQFRSDDGNIMYLQPDGSQAPHIRGAFWFVSFEGAKGAALEYKKPDEKVFVITVNFLHTEV